jgi:hypothetical protein
MMPITRPPAAGRQRRIGHDAHQARAATAVHELAAVAANPFAHPGSHIGKGRIGAEA